MNTFLSYFKFGLALLILLVSPAMVNFTSGADAVPETVPQIDVARPVTQTVDRSRRLPGTVEAVDRAVLRARVSGYLQHIEFREGAAVRKGDALFRIDARPYEARLADAAAALALARADADVAGSEFERAARLVERNAVSGEEAERRGARAAMAAARVEAAEAAVRAASLDLEYTVVRAPFDGRIGRATQSVGNLVSSADELAVLVALDELHVRFDIEESALALHGVPGSGDWTVDFTVPNRDERWHGPVSIVGNEIRAGTGSVRLYARIQNPAHVLLPGMFGEVELVLGTQRDALLIDDKAIGTDQGRRFVLVVNDSNVLEHRAVTLGGAHGSLREITAGISGNDRIVVNGLLRFRAGTRVEPIEVDMSTVAGTLLPSRPASNS